MRGVASVVFLGLSFAAGAARADAGREREGRPAGAGTEASAFRFSVGTGLTFGLSDVEERQSDVYGIGSSAYRWNVSVAPSWQLARAWAAGARGSWSSDAGARGTGSSDGSEVALTRSLWQLAAELRYQPGGGVGPYLSVGAGAAAARDSIGERTVTQWGPTLGAGVGCDWRVSGPFALGLELRGGLAWFDSDGAALAAGSESTRYVYGTTAWLGLNLTGTLAL